MKLYVLSRKEKKKHYLKQSAETKRDLFNQLESDCFSIDGEVHSISDVVAESSENTAGAMALGGALGVVGGVAGVVVGSLLGALIGNDSDTGDKEKAEKFNRSTL